MKKKFIILLTVVTLCASTIACSKTSNTNNTNTTAQVNYKYSYKF